METPRRNRRAVSSARQIPLISRARSVPVESVLPFLRGRDAARVAWSAPDGFAVAARGAAATLSADGPDRFASIRSAAADLFQVVDDLGVPAVARPRLFGGFAFRDQHEATPPWLGFPGARFILPRAQLVRDGDEAWLTVSARDPDATPDSVERALDEYRAALAPDPGRDSVPPGVAETSPTTSREEWRAQVTAAVDRIEAGRLEKVVLAQALTAALRSPLSLPDVLGRLGERYPACYRFLVEPTADAAFFGATPERLVSLRDGRVETEALAGSIARGDTEAEDAALARSLAESEKVRHEHEVVVDTIRDQLASRTPSVTVGDRELRRLANVQHLRTPITADIADAHVLSLVEALHPTPAMGGVPLDAARRTIRDTESFDRGWYASPVGWFDADGEGEFAVGIRSAVAAGDSVTAFAGNGIVADSDPDAEWDEVRLKLRPILDALEGV